MSTPVQYKYQYQHTVPVSVSGVLSIQYQYSTVPVCSIQYQQSRHSIVKTQAEGGQDTQDTGHAQARTRLRTHLGHT